MSYTDNSKAAKTALALDMLRTGLFRALDRPGATDARLVEMVQESVHAAAEAHRDLKMIAEWVGVGSTMRNLADVVVGVSDFTTLAMGLRERLAETLGLTDPSDDELVEAVRSEQISKVTLCAQLAAVLGFPMAEHNPPDSDLVDAAERAYRAPTLTDAPLPEGREGESIVVYDRRGVGGRRRATACQWINGTWLNDHSTLGAESGATGYRWAYVVRVEG